MHVYSNLTRLKHKYNSNNVREYKTYRVSKSAGEINGFDLIIVAKRDDGYFYSVKCISIS